MCRDKVGQVLVHCLGEHIVGQEPESMVVVDPAEMMTIIVGYLLVQQVSDPEGPGEPAGGHVETVRVVVVGRIVDELVVPVTAEYSVVETGSKARMTRKWTPGRTMAVLGWTTSELKRVVREVVGHAGSEHTIAVFVVPEPVSCSRQR